LGAALPRQEAQAGGLARALIASIEELSTRYVTQEYLYLDQIVPAINQHLLKAGIVQVAIRSVVDSPLEIPKFFPNRSFLDTDGKPVTANNAQRAISDEEFRAHWGPRARGVEFDNQPGFYFSGRVSVLGELIDYLNDPSDSKTIVVTGSPGSGKSAILSRLINLSIPELRAKWPSDDLGPAVLQFDLALHARGRTLQDAVFRLSEILNVAPSLVAVLDALRTSPRQIRLVVDALDEAAEPRRIAADLLRPLASYDSVKLIVGTRIGGLAALGDAEIIDIDRPENAQRQDIVDYVRARLLRQDERGEVTPYSGRDSLVNAVAKAVAEKAYPNFLVARLIVEGLLSQDGSVDPNNISFPGNVAAAFDLYLSKFGDRETIVRDLLLPLAFAMGQGLPWDDIWAPLATALSQRKNHDRRYSDDDIRWLLAQAGAFILETTENGRSVFRLFHQALADTLRVNEFPDRIHATFTEVLFSTVPERAIPREKTGTRGKDWQLANLYIRSYLSVHADAGGSLLRFLEDPLFLLAANPEQLLAVLAASRETLPPAIVGAYRDIVHRIGSEPASINGAYLEMFARKRGIPEFADRISNLPLSPVWDVPWARWTPPAPSRSMAAGEGKISYLRADMLGDGRSVALAGRLSGTVEVWDIATGRRSYRWESGSIESVKSLAIAHVAGHDLLVSAWVGGQLGTLDLMTENQVIRSPKRAGDDSANVTAMCLTERRGVPVCITSHQDDHISIWELPTLRPILERNRTGAIYDLHALSTNGQLVLLGAGDSLGDSLELGEGVDWKMSSRSISTLRLLSLDDLSVIWEDATDRNGYFDRVSIANLFDHHLLAGYRAGTQQLEIWDIGEYRLTCSLQVKAQSCWFHRFRDEVLLVWEWFGELGAKRLTGGVREGRFFVEAQDFGAIISVQGNQFTEILYDQNRPIILSVDLDHVRAYDLDDLLRESLEKPSPPQASSDGEITSGVRILRNNSKRPEEFYIGSENRVLAVDALNGRTKWELELETMKTVMQIKVLPSGNTLVVADAEGSIHLVDVLEGGVTQQVIHTGYTIEALEIASWNGRSIAFFTGQHGRVWSTRIWDLDNGQEIPTDGTYGLRFGQEDKILHGLAVQARGASMRFAFAGQYSKIMVADFDGKVITSRRALHGFEEWLMPFGSPCYTRRLAVRDVETEVLLAAGNEEGDIAIFNFDTGKVAVSRRAAHIGRLNALAFNDSPTRVKLLSAGADGLLRFWTAQLEELLTIETGEPISDVIWLSDHLVVVAGTGGMMMIRLSER
jgi:WD40 repeat protein